MYDNVLVPTDGSQGGEGAIARALDLARTGDATVHALFALDTGRLSSELTAADREGLHQRLGGRETTVRIVERATDLGLEALREVREGVPHRVILEYVEQNDVDLVVMGTHGRTGVERTRLGSTTERVLTLADVPVMAVRLDGDGAEPVPESGYGMYDHVVVTTDGSDVAEKAAEHGLEIAERYGADVHAVYVVDTTAYGAEDTPRSVLGPLKQGGRNAVDAVATEARERNLPVTTEVLRGVPHEVIPEYATGVDADLITMGARGRGTRGERLLGSTTARVVRRSAVPVLTLRA